MHEQQQQQKCLVVRKKVPKNVSVSVALGKNGLD